jgi:hypothetical protein
VEEALAPRVWGERARRHEQRVEALVAGHRERRRAGRRHPVEDFLFTYYSHSPAKLRRWHPGVGVVALGSQARALLGERYHTEVTLPAGGGGRLRGVGLDVAAFARDKATTLEFVSALLAAVEQRPAHLGCFGLHEWAMVYRLPPEQLRHAQVPLRLGSRGTDQVVESHRIRCSHYDAFRFFTPEARGRNRLQPTRSTQVHHDQSGCLHVTMDLYKWAYKLVPAVPAELVADCFELAREVRTMDMRASPYDLSAHGYTPVRIETPEGKQYYTAAQKDFARRGAGLRARIREVCSRILPAAPPSARRAQRAEEST